MITLYTPLFTKVYFLLFPKILRFLIFFLKSQSDDLSRKSKKPDFSRANQYKNTADRQASQNWLAFPPMSLKFEHLKTEYIFVNGVAGFIAYN